MVTSAHVEADVYDAQFPLELKNYTHLGSIYDERNC